MLSRSSLHFKEQARSQRRLGPLMGLQCWVLSALPHGRILVPRVSLSFLPKPGVFLILALQVSQASILTAAAAKLFLISSASEKCLGMSLIYIGQV